MDNAEFLKHMNIIKDLIKKSKYVRIILLHPPYTESQQVIIDTICSHSKQIIGQIERKPPIKDAAEEIRRIIQSNTEPASIQKKIQYVILGQQKPKREQTSPLNRNETQ